MLRCFVTADAAAFCESPSTTESIEHSIVLSQHHVSRRPSPVCSLPSSLRMERNHLVTTLVAAAAIGVGVYLYFNSSAIGESSTRSSPPAPTTPATTERSIESQPAKPAAKETVLPAAAPKLRNHAFVFIKPHANTLATQDLVVRAYNPSHCNHKAHFTIFLDEYSEIKRHPYLISWRDHRRRD